MQFPSLLTTALRAFQQAQAELRQEPPPTQAIFPRVEEVLEKNGPPPENTLLLGVATDGLPLLLSFKQSGAGPILLVGDQGSGKTTFLQAIAQSAEHFSRPGAPQLIAVSDFPAEWESLPVQMLQIMPGYEPETGRSFERLAARIQARPFTRPILLLFDGLDSILHFERPAFEAFANLLVSGPRNGLWPLVTVNAARAAKLPEWLAFFRTRIYGRIAHPETADELTPIPGAGLAALFPGAQFCIRQPSRWLTFWLPSFS